MTLLVLNTTSLSAAEWVFDISASPTFGYNDNVFLQEDEKGSSDFSIRPTASLTRSVDNMSSTISVGYAVQRYFSVSTLDSTNPFAEFDASYDLERMTFGLQATYKEDTTRNEALEDTGDFSSNEKLRYRSIMPSFSYQLSELDSLTVSSQVSETEYSSTDSSDNETKSLTVGWQRQFTERFSGGLSTTVSNYEIDGLTSSSDDDNYNVSVTSNYQLSEVWGLNASVGFRRLDSTRMDAFGNKSNTTSSGSSYQISSQYTDGKNSYSVDLSKQLSPSSTGQVNEQQRIGGSWSRPLTEKLSSNITLGYQETESAASLSGNNQSKRKNLDFSPSLQWRVSSNMSLNFKYGYRQQKEDGPSGKDVDSNSFSVNFNYDWDGIRVSR
jgi:predicted porin